MADSSIDIGNIKVAVSDLETGTDGELITWDSSGNPATVSTGTSGQVLTSNGAGAAPTFQASGGGGGLAYYGEVASTSGSSVAFTSLPANIIRLTVIFNRVGISSGGGLYAQIGDSGGLETTGYISTGESGSSRVRITNGFACYRATSNSGDLWSGHLVLTRLDSGSDTWISTFIDTGTNTTARDVNYGAGSKTLSGELDRLSMLLTTGTFSSGSMNILYET